MCFHGKVPAGLLVTLRQDAHRRFFWKRRLILDAGSGVPYESRPENVEAMTEAVFDYGLNR